MTNIGLVGDVCAPKTRLLRMLVRYINTGELETIKGGIQCSVVKTYFSEAHHAADKEPKKKPSEMETTTIHPNRVIFRETESGRNHTIFAPGGGNNRPTIKMGLITIGRIATRIMAVFAGEEDLPNQFEFFSDMRFVPDSIYVCLTASNLIEGKELETLKHQIEEFFQEKKRKILGFFLIFPDIEVSKEKTDDKDTRKHGYNNYFMISLVRTVAGGKPLLPIDEFVLTEEELALKANQQILKKADKCFNEGLLQNAASLYVEAENQCIKYGFDSEKRYAVDKLAEITDALFAQAEEQLDKGLWEDAISLSERAKKVSSEYKWSDQRKNADPLIAMGCQQILELAHLKLEQNSWQKALELSERAKNICIRHNLKKHLARVKELFATINQKVLENAHQKLEQGLWEEALTLANQSKSKSIAFNLPKEVKNAKEQLAQLKNYLLELARQKLEERLWDQAFFLYETSKAICEDNAWEEGVKQADNFIADTQKKRIQALKDFVLDFSNKVGRIFVSEIAELCSVKAEGLIIKTINEMIQKKEISAYYFDSTRSIVFEKRN